MLNSLYLSLWVGLALIISYVCSRLLFFITGDQFHSSSAHRNETNDHVATAHVSIYF